MTVENFTETDLRRRSRIAAFWYLLLTVTGPFVLIYIPSRFIVAGDVASTLARIASAPALFQIGIVVGFASSICYLLAGLALYDLFKPVNKAMARTMAALVAVSVPIGFVGTIFLAALPRLAGGAGFLQALAPAQVHSLSAAFLDMQLLAGLAAQIFWGLWLLPLGILVIRSGFFPKLLGVLQVIACFGYLAASLIFFLLPSAVSWTTPFITAMELGELPFILWLLIAGARAKPARQASAAGAA